MKLKIGFIGVGGIAQDHLKHVHQSGTAEVTAVCDISQKAVDASASQYQAKAYSSHNEMLDAQSLDAVFICVPPFAHSTIERDVTDRGIHLLVEKPVGLDMQEVQKTATIIRKNGVINSTGYCLRYWDIVQEAKVYLADKAIAMLVGYYSTKFVTAPWWRQMSKSGGQLVEQTTHIVDLLRYLSHSEVVTVHALMSLMCSQDIEDLDIPDVGVVNLQFASGAVGHVHTTFTQPDHRSGVEIYGRDFRVTIDGGTLTIVERGQTILKKSANDFYHTQDTAFLEAIRTSDRSGILAPYDEAVRTLEVTLAANESAHTGQVVRLSSL